MTRGRHTPGDQLASAISLLINRLGPMGSFKQTMSRMRWFAVPSCARCLPLKFDLSDGYGKFFPREWERGFFWFFFGQISFISLFWPFNSVLWANLRRFFLRGEGQKKGHEGISFTFCIVPVWLNFWFGTKRLSGADASMEKYLDDDVSLKLQHVPAPCRHP